MRRSSFLTLLLFTFHSVLVSAENTYQRISDSGAKNTNQGVSVKSDSSLAGLQAVDAHQSVQGDHTAVHADAKPDGSAEEEARGLKKLFRWKPKNVAKLQRSPTLMKGVEHLKNNPALITKNLRTINKSNPTVVKRFEAVANNPGVVESLQKAPKAQSAKKLNSFLTKDEDLSDDIAELVWGLGLLFIAGSIVSTISWAFGQAFREP
ncbi:hypothetical protein F442_05356 [Phytophthora nicotianae P10297]|uniref:RxLR effector protein n=2 Tax=Phytophthora nicotianae TaxID=4792 RepID=W2ZPQ2_PHYNI|nr:hypothetical protein L917_05008 [Phytophthora nicotianae]ETP49005.1 hypothetical protein F442_05356 [Phytophthora nicotianae P10297]